MGCSAPLVLPLLTSSAEVPAPDSWRLRAARASCSLINSSSDCRQELKTSSPGGSPSKGGGSFGLPAAAAIPSALRSELLMSRTRPRSMSVLRRPARPRDRCPAHWQVPPSYYIPAAGTPMRILACRRCATYAEQQAAPSGDVSPACDRHAACGLPPPPCNRRWATTAVRAW